MVLLTGDVPHEADGETVAAVTAGIEGEADAHNEMPGVSGGGFGSIIAANLRKDTVNGARAPFISGEFHYFRVPKKDWKERLLLRQLLLITIRLIIRRLL